MMKHTFNSTVGLLVLYLGLAACKHETVVRPAAQVTTNGGDDHGGHGSDDPPGDDHDD